MQNHPSIKLFTLEEANKLIPLLTERIKNLQTQREGILALEVEIDSLELISTNDEAGKSPALDLKMKAYEKAIDDFKQTIDEIHAYGCLLKDIDLGLIDFYTLHKGRMVYLCWKLGDPEVSHWHEIGRGYLSRQPIACEEEGV